MIHLQLLVFFHHLCSLLFICINQGEIGCGGSRELSANFNDAVDSVQKGLCETDLSSSNEAWSEKLAPLCKRRAVTTHTSAGL